MSKTTSKTTISIEALEAERDQIDAEARELQAQLDELRSRRSKLNAEIASYRIPYQRGDIVEDEKGVQYRVTQVLWPGEPALRGIRLTKEGHEAHKDPRSIYSRRLRKVMD